MPGAQQLPIQTLLIEAIGSNSYGYYITPDFRYDDKAETVEMRRTS
jgi:hypothetical protein